MEKLIIISLLFACGCGRMYDKNEEKYLKEDSVDIIYIGSKANLKGKIKNIYSADEFYDSTIQVDENNVPINKDQRYIPEKIRPAYDFDGKPKEGYFSDYGETRYLFVMKEPLLFNKKQDKEIYRFTWLRTFDEPVMIRIEKLANDYQLYWKITNGKGGYEPGEIVIDTMKTIKESEWSYFKYLLYKMDYWNWPLGKWAFGCDGENYILEGIKDEKYHVVCTFCDPIKPCKYLVKLAGLTISEEDSY